MPPTEVPLLIMREAESILRAKNAGFEWSIFGSKASLEFLDFLPVAITQTAALISENRVTIEDCLALFRISDSG